jgi:hypothetical protein
VDVRWRDIGEGFVQLMVGLMVPDINNPASNITGAPVEQNSTGLL